MERMQPKFKGLRIIEIGCGRAKYRLALRTAQSIHAIDFSEGMLAKAREKISRETVNFTVADIRAPWPCEDEAADLRASCLEHVENLNFVFSESARVLDRAGKFFSSVNCTPSVSILEREQIIKVKRFRHSYITSRIS